MRAHSAYGRPAHGSGPFVFLAIAYAGMWAAMSPLLARGYERSDGRSGPDGLAQACIGVAMFAPALAAVLVIRYVEPSRPLRQALALRLPRPLGRALRACLTALAVPAGLTLAALGLGTVTGTYPFGELDGDRLGAWAARVTVTLLVSLPQFAGEELGWQGYLFPRLARSGEPRNLVRAYAATGAAFALWHVPTLLMGGQYPGRPWYVAVPAMVISCVLGVPVFAWLRIRSGSILPSVLGHAFVSTVSVGMVGVLAAPDAEPDPLTMGLFGWPGWVVMGGFVAFLAVTGRLGFGDRPAGDRK
ncbi:CPBP family glutamic-type intramembrane protease [Streptomyces sp. NPDC001135]